MISPSKNNLVLLISVTLITFILYTYNGYSYSGIRKNYQAHLVSPLGLKELIEENSKKYVIIDVRSKQEYDKGHIPGALHADYHDTAALRKATNDKIPVTYCAYSAMRGPYAAYQLYLMGYNPILLNGGISAWAEDILELESKDPKINTVFNHPKNIFPTRESKRYPANQGIVEINIRAKQFNFTPNIIRVKHGQTVLLKLLSVDVSHGFSLPEFGIEEELLPMEPKSVKFIADRKGNFPFVCSVICGHNHASMVGNIIID